MTLINLISSLRLLKDESSSYALLFSMVFTNQELDDSSLTPMTIKNFFLLIFKPKLECITYKYLWHDLAFRINILILEATTTST